MLLIPQATQLGDRHFASRRPVGHAKPKYSQRITRVYSSRSGRSTHSGTGVNIRWALEQSPQAEDHDFEAPGTSRDLESRIPVTKWSPRRAPAAQAHRTAGS